MTDQIRLNNTVFSHQSCQWKLDAIPYDGILSMDFEEKRERKIVYAAKKAGRPIGWTAGKYTVPPIKLVMLKASGHRLLQQMTVKGLGSYGDAEFNMTMQNIEPGNVPITHVFEPVCITGVKDGTAEGVEELTLEFEMACLSITRDGMRLWSVLRSLGL